MILQYRVICSKLTLKVKDCGICLNILWYLLALLRRFRYILRCYDEITMIYYGS